METGLAVAKLAGGFAVVAGLLWAGLGAVKRWGGGLCARRGDLPIALVSERALSPRQRLVVAEVAGRRYLLGVSPQEIRFLAALGEAPPGEAHPFGAPAPSAESLQ